MRRSSASSAPSSASSSAPEPVAEPVDGRPVVAGTVEGPAEAVVTLVDTDGRQHGRAGTTDGRYRLPVPAAGTWLVIVSAPGHAPQARRVEVRGGDDRAHDLRLTLTAR
ncbi:carboxypeptidase-like regulatory domain-containing protein [Actinomycetospora sp. OC33-EN06]|uniref:Carboxypeptidase-like regulatory domain-containing protein n=1 Tax=Actinomycetospora aeridis TaxID=3129231 RepID=A0ABU8NB25_9PSEU